MAQVKRNRRAAQKVAATNSRSFRTFLLVSQWEAKEIGQRIALARDLAGMTQEQLAELTSFSKRSLQDYETGVTIPWKHFRELARLLRKPEEWFLYGDPEESSAEDALAEVKREQAETRAAVASLEAEMGRLRAAVEATIEELRARRGGSTEGSRSTG